MGIKRNDRTSLRKFSYLLPTWVRNLAKRMYLYLFRYYSKCVHIKRGAFVYLGPHFRFSRKHPYRAFIGENTHAEEFNVWDAQCGDIHVGRNCWFGLFNVVMGPVEIGESTSTGPFVKILGPRHALHGYGKAERADKTVIGKNVWISTDCIIHFGLTIGDNAVLGPGSVVTRDVAANTYVAGNPARDLTKVSNLEELMRSRAEEAAKQV